MVKTPLDAIHEFVGKKFSDELSMPIRLSTINSEVLKTWQEKWESINDRHPPNGGWKLKTECKNRKERSAKKYRFDVVVWHHDELCGLCLGHISKDNKHNVIEYIEGSPKNNHPLQGHILNIILTTGFEYAKELKKNDLILLDPVDSLLDIYQEKFGFELKKDGRFNKTPYCIKEVEK